MRVQRYRVAGDPVTIRVVEDGADLDAFRLWWQRNAVDYVAFDTEATGLDTFSRGFRPRLAQFGNCDEAWVLPVDPIGGVRGALDAAADALRALPKLLAHNAKFDALVAATHFPRIELRALWSRITDTKIWAHLIDPRGPQDPGGIGTSLKPLSAKYIDPDAPDTQAGLYGEFHKIGHTKSTGWAHIALDNELYTLYAGLDVIFAARLARVLAPIIAKHGYGRLSDFEHQVAYVCARMEQQGFLIDVEYAEKLVETLDADAEKWARVAAKFGVSSVNSPAQVSAALLGMGEELTETTETGALSVGKSVLLPLADLNPKWEPLGVRKANPLATAVLRSKRAGKWSKSYAQAMLDLRDDDDRLHADIASLQARTARMSISRPPLQQLPSSDHVIRRAMLAEVGFVVGAVDYQAVEMRVLAALSEDPVMIQAILDGEDLHSFTARLVYGDDFTDWHRKVCKGIGFGKVYGGGPDAVSELTGAPFEAVKRAMREYDRVFRGVKRWSARLVARAEYGEKAVYTPAGRRLPLDRKRLYAATNYVVQSSARDVLAQALVELDELGLTEFLRLPVHDEVVFAGPVNEAEEIGRLIAQTMTVPNFRGVPLATDLEIGGSDWGSLYRKGEHRKVDVALAA